VFETNVRQDAGLQDVIRNEIHAILEKRFMNKKCWSQWPKTTLSDNKLYVGFNSICS